MGDIPSSYAEILGETNFQPREFPRSGWKAEGVERKRKKKKKKIKKKVGENNGQLRFVRHHRWWTQAAWTNSFINSCGARKMPRPKLDSLILIIFNVLYTMIVKIQTFQKKLEDNMCTFLYYWSNVLIRNGLKVTDVSSL